jgi:hypothetical protein
MSPNYLLKILFNITHNFACGILLVIIRRDRKIAGYYLDSDHGRFLPDLFRVIAIIHVECWWVNNRCHEVTHTKPNGGVELCLKSFLTWAWYRCEWSASRPAYFILGKQKRFSLYRWLGGLQSRSERFGVERNLLPGFENRSIPSLYLLSYHAFR